MDRRQRIPQLVVRHRVEALAGVVHSSEFRQEAFAILVKPGVLDGDRGVGREHDRDLFVLVAELVSADLLGEVQVADGSLSAVDRHAEKGVHRCVMRWHPGELGMRRKVLDADGTRVGDEQAEQSVTRGWLPQLCPLGIVDAARDEPLQMITVCVQHTQRGEPGPDHHAGRFHDLRQHGVELVLGGNSDPGSAELLGAMPDLTAALVGGHDQKLIRPVGLL